MVEPKAYVSQDMKAPKLAIFDSGVCKGCNRCVEVCPADVFMPNPKKGKPPLVVYPDECDYCGCCVKDCPLRDKGAIEVNRPLYHSVHWKRKETGEHFRVGMKNPPPPNTRPPVGGWDAKA